MIRTSERFEYKYVLSLSQYYAVKHALAPFVTRDFYTEEAPNSRYLVRSLYYDTHALHAFHERDDGQFGRIKIRVRSYVDTVAQCEQVSIELKTKRGAAMIKHASLIDYDVFSAWFDRDVMPEAPDPVWQEFLRLLHVRSLQPQLLVEYTREGYMSRTREPLRITFDHGVQSSRANVLFPIAPAMRYHRPKRIILEIKCGMSTPDWLKRIVRTHSLKAVPNSKYVQGIEVIRPHMLHFPAVHDS
ncbi:MAG: polyphosphate polymerase domain-containing protein [Acholeplasmatales bacterium]|nr:MAG: polyphosphate polymerase domain-containing protein [Acholeplasmatales bacterium]